MGQLSMSLSGLIWPNRQYQEKLPIQCKIVPFWPYLDYIVFMQVSFIRNGYYKGWRSGQLNTYVCHYKGLYCQPRLCETKKTYVGQNRAFLSLFRLYGPHMDEFYITQVHLRQPRCQPDTIQVSPIGPMNHQGQPWVQLNTYKVDYRSLYGQPRQYQAKTIQEILGPTQTIQALCR